jgi:hypothetical protein
VYSNVTPQLRLLWGAGSLSVPITNDIISIPGANDFYLVDLGEIRIDPQPIGTPTWYGGVQAYAAAGGSVYIDKVYYEPLDDSAGTLQYTNILSAAVVVNGPAYPTSASNGTGGTAWTNPTNIEVPDNTYAEVTITSPGGFSDPLLAEGCGFAVPTGTTIVGIKAEISMGGLVAQLGAQDQVVELLKAGTAVGSNKATFQAVTSGSTVASTQALRTYGGSNDLWGTTWTPAQVNASNFGLSFTAAAQAFSTGGMAIDYIRITVYYEYSGFVIPTDAVVYPNGITEIRTEGAYRANTTGAYGKVSRPLGRLPRIPPSGMEARPVELFLRPSRGDLGSLPDEGLDAFTAQVLYRPSSIFRT